MMCSMKHRCHRTDPTSDDAPPARKDGETAAERRKAGDASETGTRDDVTTTDGHSDWGGC